MNNINTLTVYLGSSGHAHAVYKDAAQNLGRLIAQHDRKLVYGGMDAGLMGILAQTTLKFGGHVTGIIPKKIKDSERILTGLDETILVDDLCDRKKDMFLMADAVLALPGGFGTLDESLEVLYWGGLGLHTKPLVLINVAGYWDDLIPYIRSLPDFDERFLIVTDDVETALSALEQWSAPPSVLTPRHLPHFEDEITRGTDEPILIRRATIENTYYLICALGLKQLGKHTRPIGIYNPDGRFDGLLKWIQTAAKETFITEKCLKLFDTAPTEDELLKKIKNQPIMHIDLHAEKWGDKS